MSVIEDFDYDLPADRIAQRPLERRTASRLLRWRADGGFEHRRFGDLVELLRDGDLLVLNDTRVFPARLWGHKERGGARIEILLVRPIAGGEGQWWEALLRPGRRLPPGSRVRLDEGPVVEVGESRGEGLRLLAFGESAQVTAYCRQRGHVPLPPYIRREDDAEDRARYQTVFAKEDGSVAAPTAGLHFDPALLDALRRRGIDPLFITLHVGPATFRPLDESLLRRGELHPEAYSISASAVARLLEQRSERRRIIAVGTTVCRALESLPPHPDGDQRGETRLFIRPGHPFRYVDVLVTNFHLPRSSLLMLVAAFAGNRWQEAYRLAIAEGYRFYSYGDANLIEAAS